MTPPWVKTSLGPGSRVVTDYLDRAGLTPYLEKLGFALVGYGCTTCIGNSGPLPEDVARGVEERDLVVVAVLSGNRNFEGRIHPQVQGSYLASPPLVVAYGLAGRIDLDLSSDPLGMTPDGAPVYLRDLLADGRGGARSRSPTRSDSEQFEEEYGRIFDGDERWRDLPSPTGPMFAWDPDSTYVREPPFFEDLEPTPPAPTDVEGARALVVLGDSITTDHISPAAIDRAELRGREVPRRSRGPAGAGAAGTFSSPHQPTPSALSLRCRAERSMPTNSAVREILPEKRLIWAIR